MYERNYHNLDLSQSSFLITGGAGFIGSNILEYLLKHGAGKVVVLDNLITGRTENIKKFEGLSNFRFIQGDISEVDVCKEACKGMDYVLHQAALGSVPRSIERPLDTNKANIDGFLNMLVAARDVGVKRFVYASSSSVYGDSKELPKVESRTGNPLSPYAVTKQVNELYASVFAKNYNFPVIGLRYFNVYGPNQDPSGPYAAAMPLFIQSLLQGKAPFINGDGEQTRDFTFVENAVQANIKALFVANPEALNQVYNVAVGDRISINQLYFKIKDILGSPIEPVYREERKGDIRDSHADISKARTLLGYEPHYNITDGLKITIEWYKRGKK